MQKYFMTEEWFEVEKQSIVDWHDHMTAEGLELKIQYCRLSSLSLEIQREAKDSKFYGEQKRLWAQMKEVDQELEQFRTSGLFDNEITHYYI